MGGISLRVPCRLTRARPLNSGSARCLAEIVGIEVNAKAKPGVVFLVLGLAFIALGLAGQRVFLAVGLVFLVIGVAAAIRQRRGVG